MEGVSRAFSDMVGLKLQGYLDRHEIGAMPLDSSDFVADHILFYQDSRLVLGVKSLLFDLCGVFQIDFTIEAFLKKGGHGEHLEVLKQIIADTQADGRKISYYSSWTMAPSTRVSPANVAFLKELFAACTYFYHRQEGISDLLGAGLPKFKTDQFFGAWGFERFARSHENVPLAMIPAPIFSGIDYVAMHLSRYSEHVIRCAERHKCYWEERVEVGMPFTKSPFALARMPVKPEPFQIRRDSVSRQI